MRMTLVKVRVGFQGRFRLKSGIDVSHFSEKTGVGELFFQFSKSPTTVFELGPLK